MERDIKVITLGASQAGKTSIINRIVSKKFNECTLTTVGNETSIVKWDYKKKI